MRKNQELRLVENFMRQVEFDLAGHWVWTGSIVIPNPNEQTIPYGRYHYTLNGETIQEQAHRFIYQVIKQNLGDTENLLNECGNTLCVNPEHWKTKVIKKRECLERHQVLNKSNKIEKDELGKVIYSCPKCNAVLGIRQTRTPSFRW